MSENTSIEWCDHTWSPVWGCTEVSKAATGGGGCDNCYARVLAHRFGTGWNGAPMREFDDDHWDKPLRWNKRAEKAGTRPKVFPSMCDPFDKNWPAGVRARFFDLIFQTPNLNWLLLTKRIGNVVPMIEEVRDSLGSVSTPYASLIDWLQDWIDGTPPANVWIGATVVNQAEADRDIPKLLQVPARVRFLSMEPLLGPVDLNYVRARISAQRSGITKAVCYHGGEPWVDWVIVGGESGHHARPMHPDWARSLRDQCQAAGVPFLFKQWGEYMPGTEGFARNGDVVHEHGVWSVRVGKKAAGRLLDGRTWDEVPA